ncbi:MAG: hypothetical protein ACJ76D_03130 [Solirubrobacterales bacterium]
MFDLLVEIHELMEVEARAALEAGWAEVRTVENVTGPTLHLEPVKLAAAPLEIYFDSDQLLVCSPGRSNMVVEFFSEDPEEIKHQVKALTAAVVAGTYSERLRDGTTQIEARWPGAEGPRRAMRTVIAVPGTENHPWRELAYEPY